jgi:hypothetical protein
MIRYTGNALLETRKYKRIQNEREVNIKTQFGRNFKLEIFDYSMSGMSLVSPTAFEQGDILEFEYLTTRDGNKRMLDLKGEVIYCQKEFGEYIFGVSFL